MLGGRAPRRRLKAGEALGLRARWGKSKDKKEVRKAREENEEKHGGKMVLTFLGYLAGARLTRTEA